MILQERPHHGIKVSLQLLSRLLKELPDARVFVQQSLRAPDGLLFDIGWVSALPCRKFSLVCGRRDAARPLFSEEVFENGRSGRGFSVCWYGRCSRLTNSGD